MRLLAPGLNGLIIFDCPIRTVVVGTGGYPQYHTSFSPKIDAVSVKYTRVDPNGADVSYACQHSMLTLQLDDIETPIASQGSQQLEFQMVAIQIVGLSRQVGYYCVVASHSVSQHRRDSPSLRTKKFSKGLEGLEHAFVFVYCRNGHRFVVRHGTHSTHVIDREASVTGSYSLRDLCTWYGGVLPESLPPKLVFWEFTSQSEASS